MVVHDGRGALHFCNADLIVVVWSDFILILKVNIHQVRSVLSSCIHVAALLLQAYVSQQSCC